MAPSVLLLLACCAVATLAESLSAAATRINPEPVEYFFYNQVSGKTQWEDPGDVPYVDENGNKFWLNEKGEWVTTDIYSWRYVWVERWSEDHKRHYYFNQETKQSTWTRPADLAWQRVPVTKSNRDMVPKRPDTPAANSPASEGEATAAGAAEAAKGAVGAAAEADPAAARAGEAAAKPAAAGGLATEAGAPAETGEAPAQHAGSQAGVLEGASNEAAAQASAAA